MDVNTKFNVVFNAPELAGIILNFMSKNNCDKLKVLNHFMNEVVETNEVINKKKLDVIKNFLVEKCNFLNDEYMKLNSYGFSNDYNDTLGYLVEIGNDEGLDTLSKIEMIRCLYFELVEDKKITYLDGESIHSNKNFVFGKLIDKDVAFFERSAKPLESDELKSKLTSLKNNYSVRKHKELLNFYDFSDTDDLE